jgi:hypothetical protein
LATGGWRTPRRARAAPPQPPQGRALPPRGVRSVRRHARVADALDHRALPQGVSRPARGRHVGRHARQRRDGGRGPPGVGPCQRPFSPRRGHRNAPGECGGREKQTLCATRPTQAPSKKQKRNKQKQKTNLPSPLRYPTPTNRGTGPPPIPSCSSWGSTTSGTSWRG